MFVYFFSRVSVWFGHEDNAIFVNSLAHHPLYCVLLVKQSHSPRLNWRKQPCLASTKEQRSWGPNFKAWQGLVSEFQGKTHYLRNNLVVIWYYCFANIRLNPFRVGLGGGRRKKGGGHLPFLPYRYCFYGKCVLSS